MEFDKDCLKTLNALSKFKRKWVPACDLNIDLKPSSIASKLFWMNRSELVDISWCYDEKNGARKRAYKISKKGSGYLKNLKK